MYETNLMKLLACTVLFRLILHNVLKKKKKKCFQWVVVLISSYADAPLKIKQESQQIGNRYFALKLA